MDGSATYRSWSSFVATLQAIITTEQAGITTPNPWVNAADYDRAANPGDHADHWATGDALHAFLAPAYGRAWWLSYDAAGRPANLEKVELEAKRLGFFAYSWSVEGATGAPPDQHEWDQWGDKEYVRVEPPG